MLKSQIQVGKVYGIKVGERVAPVRIDSTSERYEAYHRSGPRVSTRWSGTNLITGRAVRIQSAAKCRFEMKLAANTGTYLRVGAR